MAIYIVINIQREARLSDYITLTYCDTAGQGQDKQAQARIIK
jgi:hypothetical protein